MPHLEEKEREAVDYIRRIYNVFGGRLCLTTSFQRGGVVLIDLVQRVLELPVPVVMVDTRFLFDETITFAQKLAKDWKFMLVREVGPPITTDSPWHDQDACCARQKVATFRKATSYYHAWMTAIRRDQTKTRANTDRLTLTKDGKVRVAPLLSWTAKDIAEQTKRRKLPAHPLYSKGYASIGCWPCTTPIVEGEDDRAGRWRGCKKEECGIHE